MTIQLRDVINDDLPIFYLQQQDPAANFMAAFPARDEHAFLQHWTKKILGDDAAIKKTILAHDRIVGNMLCWKQSDKWFIGYWIGKEYWGQGIASKALLDFLPFCPTPPLYAYAAKHNKGSIRVLEKCGFTIHGHGIIFSEVHGHEIEEVLLIYA